MSWVLFTEKKNPKNQSLNICKVVKTSNFRVLWVFIGKEGKEGQQIIQEGTICLETDNSQIDW